MLAYLSGRVLGQYEVFSGDPGQLLLVAPNIVEVERKLGADPRDFRLWVCLHEVTHRTQFTAVPWMRAYFLGEVQAFVDASPAAASTCSSGCGAGVATLSEAVRDPESRASVLDIVQTPAQRAVLDRLTALMTLLEGHAEFVMDGVGPEVIPSVERIRATFNRRREAGNPLEKAIRRLLGIEVKMRQYAEGRKFVHGVVERVGMAGLQQDLRLAAHPAPAGRAGRPGRLGGPGARAGRHLRPPADRPPVAALAPPVAAVRVAVRRALAGAAAGRAGAGRLLRRRRLAGAGGRHRLRRAPAGPWPPAWSPSTTGCRPARRSGPRRWPAWAARRRLSTRCEAVPVDGRRPAGRPGGGRPGGPLPGAGRGAPGGTARAAVLARTHPGRPGGDGAAGAGPGRPARAGWPGCRPGGSWTACRCCARCWTWAGTQTRTACAALGLSPWEDPHNADPAYARARVRADVLPALVRALGPGGAGQPGPDRPAGRRRTTPRWTSWPTPRWPRPAIRPAGCRSPAGRAAGGGARPGCCTPGPESWAPRRPPCRTGTSTALDALVTAWHGQGPVHLPGGVRVLRRADRLASVDSAERACERRGSHGRGRHGRICVRPKPLYAPRGAVATSQPLAAAAGLAVLRRGGNAVDAALATAITLTVVQPRSNDIGGDLFAIVWDGDRLHGLNASGRSPAALTRMRCWPPPAGGVPTRPTRSVATRPGGRRCRRGLAAGDRARRAGRLAGPARAVRPAALRRRCSPTRSATPSTGYPVSPTAPPPPGRAPSPAHAGLRRAGVRRVVDRVFTLERSGATARRAVAQPGRGPARCG